MLLAYVDESFTDRWYWVGALLVPESEAIPLTDALDAVMVKAADSHGVPVDAELHGYDLFQARAPWDAVPPRARIGVYNAAMRAIGAHDVSIILRGVDRLGLANRYTNPRHPHEVVLSHLLERIDSFAAARQQLALVIADEVDNQPAHRADLTRYRLDGTGGYRSRKISRIVDTLHFAPSHASRLVQAADLVTFLGRRMATVVETDARATQANQRLWAWVERRLHHKWCWYPLPQQHKGPALAGPKAVAGAE